MVMPTLIRGVLGHAHLDQRCVLRVMVNFHWVVGSPVVGYEEGPPPAITVVGVTAMKEVAMEVQGIPRGQLHINQWQHLGEGVEG